MAKKISIEKQEIVWKDRKRFLGLPLSFTRYELCDDCLVLRKGFFNTTTDDILLYRIMDIRLTRKFSQKIFGVGTVTLVGTDKSHPMLELKNIKQSDEVRRLVGDLVEKQRAARGITSREFLGGGIEDEVLEDA
ncbi:MAG: PH domain-containing protein [Clostridiales bacterium]|jgi:uncharacterized membrane protein YdbT with pleckstrin-like domain|nr:PH domain-containing protein [Clostridiales bacterium]